VAVFITMLLPLSLLLALLAHRALVLGTPAKRTYDTHNYYVLEHDPSATSGASLDVIAQSLGVEIVEQVGELKDFWLVRTLKPPYDVRRGEQVDRVLRAYEDLRAVANQEQDSSLTIRSDAHNARRIVAPIRYFSKQTLRRRVKRAPPPISPPDVASERAIAARLGIKDPLFSRQWHLINDEHPEHMMNVTALWDMGYTGKGVISSFVDDGLDYNSEDLKANFVSNLLPPTGHIHISLAP
jgi:kexin